MKINELLPSHKQQLKAIARASQPIKVKPIVEIDLTEDWSKRYDKESLRAIDKDREKRRNISIGCNQNVYMKNVSYTGKYVSTHDTTDCKVTTIKREYNRKIVSNGIVWINGLLHATFDQENYEQKAIDKHNKQLERNEAKQDIVFEKDGIKYRIRQTKLII
jgi:uncharacterized protein YigE (DUF2233 family)